MYLVPEYFSLIKLFRIPEDVATIIPNNDTGKNKSPNVHSITFLYNLHWSFLKLFH
jgi:hypothetical protein